MLLGAQWPEEAKWAIWRGQTRSRASDCRAHRERPRSRATEQCHELAAVHCPMPPVLPTERIAHSGDCCAAGFPSRLCRLWVTLGHSAISAQCPVCPRLCCKTILSMWARNIDSRWRTAKQLRFKSALVPIRLFQNPIPQLLYGDFCNTIPPKTAVERT
jgi:hypothetical protein